MAVPSYTEDLTDRTLAEESSGWAESSDTAWDDQGPPAYQDQDYAYIQGSYSVTADTTKTGVGTLLYDTGATFTIPTDGAMLAWINFYNPNAIDTYANGGLRMILGSGVGTFWSWDVGGSDYDKYPYGGWQNLAINDTVTADDTVNSYAGGSHQVVGAGCKVLTGIGKGESFQVDAIRSGRCSAIFQDGQAGNYCTFSGYAAVNDATTARWGLIQAVEGGYLWKGRMLLGSTNACNFVDSNETVFIQNTPKVTSNFNTIDNNHASNVITWTGIKFVNLNSTETASRGRWISTANGTVTLTTCEFTDMGTFDFDSNTTALSCIFRRCDQIDPQQADMSFSDVLESNVTGGGSAGGGALIWDVAADPDTYLNDMEISKGAGAHHAIEFTSNSPTTINLTNMTFTDFSASDQQTTSVLYFPDTGSDVTWTVSHSGTTGTVSYYKARTGDTVNIAGSVPVTITVYDEDGALFSNVRVGVYTNDASRTEIVNELTVSGVASDSWTGSTPQSAEVRCRIASGGAPGNYKNYSSIQTIGANGLSLSVTMELDPNNSTT